MTRSLQLGYWAAQEQYSPDTLLKFAIRAEIMGFDIIVTSDHFHPWSDTGGQSGHTWIWLASVAERTKKVEVGTAVTTPLFRYHPAIVAQAFSTLDHLYPGRIFLTVGTGHAMNEVPLGYSWPGYREKVGRLKEAIEVIKLLWEGDFVTYEGEYYRLNTAKLYTKPKSKIRLYVATSNERVAEIAGTHTDGILTNPRGLENLKEIIESMEKAARRAGRDPSTLSKCMEFKVSYDLDYQRALRAASFWAPTAIPREKREKVADPRVLESMVTEKEIEKIKRTWLITTDSDDIFKALGDFLKLGFDRVYIHSASPNEERFLNLLGREILPWMREYWEELRAPIRSAAE
ncbi:MAG: TIGR03557 family F420-dependent LLM class oxidoreductase [Aigarchaeota archaeon]|nr:TIGR03557 family F420-dependent LLM class oxidoreductase [Aigarchaeota archaeon]MDW8092311.1 TIGR03557 family F420-dependent LLM class oxidoreductase [Nitrososphaerota archaeon]